MGGVHVRVLPYLQNSQSATIVSDNSDYGSLVGIGVCRWRSFWLTVVRQRHATGDSQINKGRVDGSSAEFMPLQQSLLITMIQ